MANSFFTIGHSRHPIEEFVVLLREAGADFVVDVRTIPRSRTNPQYNRDALPPVLAQYGIGYAHMAALGGLRGRQAGGAHSPNTFWENTSFRNYADYAATAPFRQGFDALRQLGSAHRCAIMCAEAVWWRCHRRFIADYLLAAGETVLHILGPPPRIEPAVLTPEAQPAADGTLVYPDPSRLPGL
jgi:uncharacterized protein (DUF488 family)